MAERDSFVRSIYRYSKKLLSPNEQVRFKNYRSDLFEDLQMSAELAAKLQATDGQVNKCCLFSSPLNAINISHEAENVIEKKLHVYI